MSFYKHYRYGHVPRAAFWLPPARILLGAVFPMLGAVFCIFFHFNEPAAVCIGITATSIITAFIMKMHLSTKKMIKTMIFKRLYDPRSGNPMRLREGTRLPEIAVAEEPEAQRYVITLDTASCIPEAIERLPGVVSSALRGRLSGFAVTQYQTDPAQNLMCFWIEDVSTSKKIAAAIPSDLLSENPLKITVQTGCFLDLSKSESILIAGKTRSGKTCSIISIILQVLARGPDSYGSRVVIVDPKSAELSTLPYAVSPDADGSAHSILNAISAYEDLRLQRQKTLKERGAAAGRALKWWEIDMHPCFLVLDEWVALRSFFPTRASKDDPQYCVKVFDDMIRRVVTMGASVGCYAIISTAEASVESAGIPAMIRSAIGTKILMRPTIDEGALMWSREKLAALPDRIYKPGDAWMSSSDGIHDLPAFVEFPMLDFPELDALAQSLRHYYSAGSDGA